MVLSPEASWRVALRGMSRPPGREPTSGRLVASSFVVVCSLILAWYLIPGVAGGVRAGACAPGDPACPRHAFPAATSAGCRVITHARPPGGGVAFAQEVGTRDGLTLDRVVDRDAVVHWLIRTSDGGAGGRLVQYASEDAARSDIVALRHAPVRQELRRADGTGLVARSGDRIDGVGAPVVRPGTRFVETGELLGVDAAAAGVAGRGGWDGLTGVIEVTRAADGHQTVFARLSGAALRRLGLAGTTSTGSPAPTSGVISLERDDAGTPVRLLLDVSGAMPAALGPPSDATSGSSGAAAGSSDASGPGVGGQPFSALLRPGPLGDDPAFAGRLTLDFGLAGTDLPRAAAALHAVGVPWLIGDGEGDVSQTAERPASDPSTSARQASDQQVSDRQALRAWYRSLDAGTLDALATVADYPADGPAAPAGGLDVRGGLVIDSPVPDRWFFFQPGQGFVEWQRCGR